MDGRMDGWLQDPGSVQPPVAGGFHGLLINVDTNPFGFQLESYNSTILDNSILGRQAQKATRCRQPKLRTKGREFFGEAEKS